MANDQVSSTDLGCATWLVIGVLIIIGFGIHGGLTQVRDEVKAVREVLEKAYVGKTPAP